MGSQKNWFKINLLFLNQARCTNLGAYLANFETLEEAMAMKLFLQQMNTGNI